MAAKHIKIAQGKVAGTDGRTGPRAGFDSYMASPSPLAKPTQDAIRSAGNKKAQFTAYCNHFTDEIGNAPVNTAARASHDEDEKLSMIEKLAAKFGLAVQEPVGVVVEDEPEDDMDTLIALAAEHGVTLVMPDTPKPAPKRTRTPKPQAAAKPEGEKWAPKNPNENCSSGRLWRLNQAGLLTINAKPGKPVTSGQAHTILSAIA